MGTTARVNAQQKATGVIQHTVGQFAGDKQLPAEKEAAKAVSDMKQAVETVKDGPKR
jgi:uncharacterized protein YjbJ (UPF0337 family)